MLRGRTRVPNACQRCRRQKIKCSGLIPCRTCHSRGLKCDFGAEEKQVLVSEKELLELRRRVDQYESLDSSGTDQTASLQETGGQPDSLYQNDAASLTSSDPPLQPSTISPQHVSSHLNSTGNQELFNIIETGPQSDMTNPLVSGHPTYVQETSGRLRYLGHSSTYAFTQQVLHMLQHNPPSNPSPEILMRPNGRPYRTEWHRLLPLITPDVSRLPSRGIAMHYLQCVKFRTQPLFYLFDELDFGPRLRSFYRDPFAYAQAHPLWYIHFLLLMAFGKAFDPHEQMDASSVSSMPEHLTRALFLLPDMTYLAEHPVQSTEIFCCLALYLHSIDHKQAALLYMGLALRTAHLYGIHLDLQKAIVGSHGFERSRQLWWTVYTLNQRLTSNMGIPNFLNDHDVASPLPTLPESDEDETASAIHIKICRLLGFSISRVYGLSESDRRSFVTTTRMILRQAASLATEVKHFSATCFGEISRVAAHLELVYHHFVIVTCRPALFCVLKLRSNSWAPVVPTWPSTAITGLIQVCVDSATQAVHILDQLRRYNLLDTFLPFDAECGFCAALVLIMANHAYPRVLPSSRSIETVKGIIGAIAARGNIQAKLHSLEVEKLEEMLRQQTQSARENDSTPQSLQPHAATTDNQQQMPEYGDLFFTQSDYDNGFSGHQILDLAEAINIQDMDFLGP